eukprot:CAMPEP_0115082584 /NCGR_PEP_ID=MMETSP0227-20121206/19997_1 /TAXON_ID=89957 /ORGANISM="Polarella glacialis, Strain CCMP 1383" /LENGTH=71 /DNA_ID=CAMNT_0002470719 /DNA_START=265 /DNA_END=480 /DNA_ORIENTATION=-
MQSPRLSVLYEPDGVLSPRLSVLYELNAVDSFDEALMVRWALDIKPLACEFSFENVMLGMDWLRSMADITL